MLFCVAPATNFDAFFGACVEWMYIYRYNIYLFTYLFIIIYFHKCSTTWYCMVLYGTVSAQYHTISYRFNHFTSPPWDSFGLAPPRQLRGRHRTGHRAHGAIAAAQADVDVALAQTVLPEGAEKFWKVLKDAEKYLMILRHLDVWICSMYIANNFCQWLSRSCGAFPKVLTWNPVLLWKLAWGLAMRLGLHYLLILKCGTSSIQKKTMIQLNLAEFIITMWHSDIIHQAFQKCMTLP